MPVQPLILPFARFGALLLAFAVGIILLEPRSWPYELINHFVVQLAALGGGLAALLAVLKDGWNPVLVLFLTLGLFFEGMHDLPLDARPRHDALLEGYQWSVITHNVRDTNERFGDLRQWLQTQPADVVALQEVPLREALQYQESHTYPYQMRLRDPALNSETFPGDRAIVVLSIFELRVGQPLRSYPGARPVAIVNVAVPFVASKTWLVVVDADDPGTRSTLINRDKLLLGIAPQISALEGVVVVVGDFNTTPYSPVFSDFARDAGVTLAGLPVSTFPSSFGSFGLAIDHILTRNAHVDGVSAMAAIGSDHRPVFAKVTSSIETR